MSWIVAYHVVALFVSLSFAAWFGALAVRAVDRAKPAWALAALCSMLVGANLVVVAYRAYQLLLAAKLGAI